MRVLLDTNILLVITPYFSTCRWVFDALRAGEFELVVSTEILDEYAELLERHHSVAFAERTLLALDNFPTIIRVEPAYRIQLIEADPDDNKFTDAAIAGNADYIVTNDRYFNCLYGIDFPKVGLMDFATFCDHLNAYLLHKRTQL